MVRWRQIEEREREREREREKKEVERRREGINRSKLVV